MEEFLRPEKVLEDFGARPGERAADFGCGAGFFSIPLAQNVGPKGRVYAFDVRAEALESARAKAKIFSLLNIDFAKADLERPRGSGLKDKSLDKIVICNILFQIENKEALAQEAQRILKSGGSALVIDWSEEKSIGGPPLAHRVGKEEAKELFEKAGFILLKETPAGSHHYGLIFRKSSNLNHEA